MDETPNAVRTILIEQTSPTTTERQFELRRYQLKSYFKKFGRINWLHILKKSVSGEQRVCLMNFRSNQSARLASKSRSHIIRSVEVRVLLCPNTVAGSEVTVATAPSWDYLNGANNPPEDTLMSLNANTLAMIFDALTLRMKIKFSLADRRLNEVFRKIVIPGLSTALNIHELYAFNIREIQQFFLSCGKHLKKLEIPIYSGTIFDSPKAKYIFQSIRKHCVNIVSLHIHRNIATLLMVESCIDMQQIAELDLYNCDLHDCDVVHLHHMMSLRSLGLAENTMLSGNYVELCTSLNRLSLVHCQQIASSKIRVILYRLKLVYLDVRLCVFMNFGHDDMEMLQSLETLKVTRLSESSLLNVCQLPNLRSLEYHQMNENEPTSLIPVYNYWRKNQPENKISLRVISGRYRWTETLFFEQFTNLSSLWLDKSSFYRAASLFEAIGTLPQLQELSFADCLGVHNVYLLTILQKCPKLSLLILDNCALISEHFPKNALRSLRKVEPPRTEPVYIRVGGTRITEATIGMINCNAKYNRLLRLSKSFTINTCGRLHDEPLLQTFGLI